MQGRRKAKMKSPVILYCFALAVTMAEIQHRPEKWFTMRRKATSSLH
jgi:hypothetical protein